MIDMNKEKIKTLIQLTLEFEGEATLYYIPKSVLDSAQQLYRLYYRGSKKIVIGKYFIHRDIIEITDDNIDVITDIIYELLSNDIRPYITPALDNLNMDDTNLKYFDREEEKENYKAFKIEVLRLMKENNHELKNN